MYSERLVRNAEILQIHLLDSLYAVSGSEAIYFQGGTALRWIYGGMRFSEDLDFVTSLSPDQIRAILKKVFTRAANACIAQFGPGVSEQEPKRTREEAVKVFYIFQPQTQRERIAIKLEFEILKPGRAPATQKVILRDLPPVAGMLSSGKLVMPYSSSIVVAQTADELLSDKTRALFERHYLKGRDIYDIWWLIERLRIAPSWDLTRSKLDMYRSPFVPARKADYFQQESSSKEIIEAIVSDLPRFIPKNIYALYRSDNFKTLTDTLKALTAALQAQGMDNRSLGYEG
ncbi:MAG TPA: nucleotidyl transferase AbiEii/AbiGii toxin family protein [Deltaproteobacteria bacterium]|nr:nucleotidyl transferase AbiEii/AbiGii toxin family protein [Deltaproteobacteria bacterium]